MATVSIICAVYNHEAYLQEAIESVLLQTYKDWELILWDDGSKDGSVGLCRKYAELYPDAIRFFRHYGGVNQGQEKTRNEAIQKATGQFISILDSDDYYYPRKLELLVAEMKNLEVGLVYGKAQELWQESGTMHAPSSQSDTADSTVNDLIYYNFISAGATLIRRELLNQGLSFDSRFKAIGEYPLWIEIALRSKLVFVDEIVAVWRNHGKNTGTTYQVEAKKELLDYALFLKADKRFSSTEYQNLLAEVIAQRTYDYASILYTAQRFKEAEKNYKEFLKLESAIPIKKKLPTDLVKKTKFLLLILKLGTTANKVFSEFKNGHWKNKSKKDIQVPHKL